MMNILAGIFCIEGLNLICTMAQNWSQQDLK